MFTHYSIADITNPKLLLYLHIALSHVIQLTNPIMFHASAGWLLYLPSTFLRLLSNQPSTMTIMMNDYDNNDNDADNDNDIMISIMTMAVTTIMLMTMILMLTMLIRRRVGRWSHGYMQRTLYEAFYPPPALLWPISR